MGETASVEVIVGNACRRCVYRAELQRFRKVFKRKVHWRLVLNLEMVDVHVVWSCLAVVAATISQNEIAASPTLFA